MATPITHITVTQKVLGTILKGYRKKDFIVGTVFPDICYLKVIEKEKTHPKNPPRRNVLPKGSFLSAIYFHSLVDVAREDFMVKRRVYSLCNGTAYMNDALKLLEDEVLYNKIKKWRTVIRYFDTILLQEIAFGIQKEAVRRWHVILQTYMDHTPDIESRRNLMFALRFPMEKIGVIETSVQRLKENSKVLQVIEDFYNNFETLFK